MKKVINLTRTTTIIDLIISSLLLIVIGYCIAYIYMPGDILGFGFSVIENASEHDLTGGYEVLGGLGALLAGLLVGLLIWGIMIFAFAAFVPLLWCTIHGFVTIKKWPAKNKFKFDSILKLTIHSIMLILFIISNTWDGFTIGCCVILVAVIAISVAVLILLGKYSRNSEIPNGGNTPFNGTNFYNGNNPYNGSNPNYYSNNMH